MKWTVIGADRKSGAGVKLAFEAATKEEAMRRAIAGGVRVAHVLAEGEPMPKRPPPVVTDAIRPVSAIAKAEAAPAVEPTRLPCPSCAEPVLPGAYICPHCHRTIIRNPRTILFGLASAAVAGLVIWFVIFPMQDRAIEQHTHQLLEDSREDARQMMKESQADADAMMKDAQRQADDARRKAAGQ